MIQRVFCLLLPAISLFAREYHDPAGYRVDLPEGWQAAQSKAGHFVLVSPNPQRYVFVQPVFNRTTDCGTTLRQTLTGAGSQFAAVQDLAINQPGGRQAIARFVFQSGRLRGQILCAETSRRGGTLYGLAAPVNEFAREAPRLVAVLKSFSFEAAAAARQVTNAALPALRQWQEPNEQAYTLSVPQGWQVQGGLHRRDVTHYSVGEQITSPDGSAVIQIDDQRLSECQVMGPGMASMPSAPGPQFCQMQSSAQFGAMYLQQMLARDLGLAIQQKDIEFSDRRELAQQSDEVPRSLGLAVQTSISELRFRGMRNRAPVAGSIMATTTFFRSVQGQNFILGTQAFAVRGFVGRTEQFPMLARLTGTIAASQRVNPVWYSQTQRINREVAQRTLAMLHQQAEQQQQAFWDRMAASDRRNEAVRDVLGGTVRLTDGNGNQYQARAGSNYYFRDDDAARTAGRPDDSVVGGDLWPSPMVDLTPLEVIR